MKIELILSPELYAGRQITTHHITVAVDILRATTAICAAFSAGASAIVPLTSLEPLPSYRAQGYVIAAERNGKKVDGAMCGNSPCEYKQMNLQGKKLAFSTTNGTVSIITARESEHLFVGAFANISALCEKIEHYCSPANNGEECNLVILCSGWKGDPSIEDSLFGGALIERLCSRLPQTELINDSAMMALDLWHLAKPDPYAYCTKATHVHRLQRLNYDNDIQFSLLTDTCPVVPYLADGVLQLA